MANVHNNLLEKRPSKAIDPEALLAPKGKM